VSTRQEDPARNPPCGKQFIQTRGSIIHMQQTFQEAYAATKFPRIGAGTDVYIVNQHHDGYQGWWDEAVDEDPVRRSGTCQSTSSMLCGNLRDEPAH